jgi:hypothetical protein
VEQADQWNHGLLSSRHDRAADGGCATEQGDEFPALQVIELHPLSMAKRVPDIIMDCRGSVRGSLQCGILNQLMTGLGQNSPNRV